MSFVRRPAFGLLLCHGVLSSCQALRKVFASIKGYYFQAVVGRLQPIFASTCADQMFSKTAKLKHTLKRVKESECYQGCCPTMSCYKPRATSRLLQAGRRSDMALLDNWHEQWSRAEMCQQTPCHRDEASNTCAD